MSARSSKLSADAPAWYPSTFFEAAIEACPAAEPPSVAEEAKQAPISPGRGSYEEEGTDIGSNEKGNGSDGFTHAASDPDGSDHSELGATSPESHSSSTARRRLTKGQLWGLGIAALGAVALLVGLSRRRRAG